MSRSFITGEITTWGQVVGRPEITDEIHVYTRSDAAGARKCGQNTWVKNRKTCSAWASLATPACWSGDRGSRGIGFNNLGYAYDNASGKPVAGGVPVP